MDSLPSLEGAYMFDTILYIWFILVGVSVAYVAWDAFRNNPQMVVMKWGWVLVTLYTGPINLALYLLACKEPAPGQHEEFVKPLWKQALGSQIHCLAGDGTGVIVAAAITETLGFPMWLDVISEYIFGFLFGLTIFQALFMRDTAGGSYIKALKMSFMPEWLSMNAVMAGMVPVMVILMSRDITAMQATSIRFWGVMSLATLVGGVLAYPVNVWLVARGLKHGMGTVRVLGKGGHSVEAEKVLIAADGGTVLARSTASKSRVGGHEDMSMKSSVTRPQLFAVTL
ncbi:MAG: hypothetical protein NVSMB38_22770 [Ktedonobacteraceae bacterium]